MPIEARQRTGGPDGGQVDRTVSVEMPLRSGPRHWGQSPALAKDRQPSAAENRIAPNFTAQFWRDSARSQCAIGTGSASFRAAASRYSSSASA